MSYLDARWAPAVALLVFAGVDLVLPAVRHFIRTGTTGVAFFRGDPVERVLGAAMGAGALSLTTLTVLYAVGQGRLLGMIETTPLLRASGVVVIALGTALVAIAQAQMGRSWRIGIEPGKTALVTHGLYSHIRNPIYTGLFLSLAGAVLAMPTISVALVASQLGLWVCLQTRREEAHLARLHPDQFPEYAARAGRFLPGLGTLPQDGFQRGQHKGSTA